MLHHEDKVAKNGFLNNFNLLFNSHKWHKIDAERIKHYLIALHFILLVGKNCFIAFNAWTVKVIVIKLIHCQVDT